MARAPYNVLVLPYRTGTAAPELAAFLRAVADVWQFIAGGGEDDEAPAVAARREASEEAGIDSVDDWMMLDTRATIPRTAFPGAGGPDDILVIPEPCFAVDVGDTQLLLSQEHERFEWLEYGAAHQRLAFDSNKVALWELQQRLARND